MADAGGMVPVPPEMLAQILDFFESEGVTPSHPPSMVIGGEVFRMTIDIGPSPRAIEFMDEVQATIDNLIDSTDTHSVPVTYEIDVTHPTPEEA